MGVSYKDLWKLLIDKEISKTELRERAGIAASTLSRMNKSEYVFRNFIKNLHCIGLRNRRCSGSN